MKRTLILISALFLMSMGVLAQMNIWRNGVVTHEFLLSDVDSITFGAVPEMPGGVNLQYELTEFEDDRYGNLGYCYNVIFTTPGTDFEVNEVDVGGQTGYQYVLNRGTAYMIYIISDRVISQVPEPGIYTIGWYDSGDSGYVQGEDYGRRGTFARGYNAAEGLPGTDGQHAPVGSYKMSKPEEGDYMVDYTDDDIYRYVRGGELEIIENSNGTYTWNMTLEYNDLMSERLTWTGKYEEAVEEPEPQLHPSLQGSDYFVFQMDDITYEKIASKVVADFRHNGSTNFFYIWDNTYAANTTQGLNFYGEPEGWVSLDVLSVGWSGCAYHVMDLESLNKLSAIMVDPENYYFHIAMKSTDNASHLICLDGTAGNARFCVGESAFVDVGNTYQPMAGLKRDGSWNEIEINMADLLSQGLTYANNNTNPLNVLYFLSGGLRGTNLQFDAAFIYKKNGGEIVEPELGTVKVVVDAPEGTCNGLVAVGSFCNWSLSEGYSFTKVVGTESLYEVTVPYSPDMVFKVIAKTLYDEIDWWYQWGMNRDGEEPNVVLLGTPGCVLDNSENGGEPKLVSFVDGSLTYVEVRSWKTDPCSNLDESELTEVSLTGIVVDTYYGESFPMVEETETYTIVLENQAEGCTYSISLASYPNDLAAPLEGTYTVVGELVAVEQVTVTKVSGEGAGEVAAESGTLVISGNASNMEITLNITLPDGTTEQLHFSGQVQVGEKKWEMISEQEVLNVTSMTLDESYSEYNFYYYVAKNSDYSAQGQLSAVVTSPQYPNGLMQIMLGFLFNGEQQNAATLPVGEYPFANMYNGSMVNTNIDFVTASDYQIYLLNYYGSYGYYLSSEIYTITSDDVTNIFYPQSGTLKIENGTTEGTMKFTINATSFNGSTFQGTFELPDYVESSSAPQRLAPKAAPQWNTYLFKNAKLPNVPYKRAMR